MKNPNIIIRSSYTFFKSILKIDDIINFALKNKYENASLVDKNIMYGSYEFYNKAIKNNLKPIIGLEIDYKEYKNIILIAKNEIGYYKLIDISSKISLDENIDIEEYKEDGNLFFLDKNKFPISKIIDKTQIESFNLFRRIGNLEEQSKIDHLYLYEEYKYKFGKEKLKEVEEIISNIDLKIQKRNVLELLPKFHLEKNDNLNNVEYFESKIKANFSTFIKNNSELKIKYEQYLERLKYEVKVIKEMRFESYFLIVSDIVQWAKNNEIKVGPGRGSAAGSLVSFLLDITEIDPIKNELFFERFLNPERISMPDIDIDFEDEKREEVIKYIVNKYGKENVASIITFQTLRAKLSFRDVSRIKGLNTSIVNEITKMIPENYSLKETYEKDKKFRYKIEENELNREIYKIALDLEGLPRQFSTHAAGIVISNNNIRSHVPIQKGYSDYIYQTQYSMNYLEENGLLKIDILGLRNLHFLKEIVSKVNENKIEKLDLNNIPYNDKNVFSMLDKGYTDGIFQLESPGMKKILKEMNVDSFDDIVATTSLFRPGPIKQIPTFIKRKNKQEEFTYPISELKSILEPTFGIIVYQEQIMKIVQEFSNFSLAKADILRRAIGKKDINLLKGLKEDFINGSIEKGRKEEDANKIYDLIFEFSDYGFNKSHAVSYSVISYQLMYLKTYYKIEFIWALLNSVIGNKDKTYQYILEAQNLSVIINPPSINFSSKEAKIIEGQIILSFSSISGIGDIVSKEIENERILNGEFKSFIDFYKRIQGKKVTKANIESLIKSGAFDEFEENRNTLLGNLNELQNYIDLIKVERDNKIYFDESIIKKFEYTHFEKENYFKFEVEVLGFSFEETELKRKILKFKNKINFINIKDIKWKQEEKVELVGIVNSVRELKTKTNSIMAFLTLDDGTEKTSVTIWPGNYSKFKEIVEKGSLVFIKGSVDLKRNDTIILELVEKLEEK